MLFGGIASGCEASKSDFSSFLQITLFSAEVSQNQYMQPEEPKRCLSMTSKRKTKEEKLLQKKDSNVSPDRNLLEAPFPPEGSPPFPVAWGPCVVHGSFSLSRDHCLKGGAHA